jgi:hypothetical protein
LSNLTNHDPRLDLEPLPSETLFHIARNPSAAHRALAARLLVERGSPLACADDVLELAQDVVFSDPIALATCHKNMDAATGPRLPGPIDLIASGLHKNIVLATKVVEAHGGHARDIAVVRQELQRVLNVHEKELKEVQAKLECPPPLLEPSPAPQERSPWQKLKNLVDHSQKNSATPNQYYEGTS